MLQAERIAEYLPSGLPQVSDIAAQNLFRSPGGASRETSSCNARWREGDSKVFRMPTGFTGWADGVSTN